MVTIKQIKNSKVRSNKSNDLLTVIQLKKILKEHNLDIKGNKIELVDRILSHFSNLKNNYKIPSPKIRSSCPENSKYANNKNYICNEKTNRWIKIGGPTYNKIHNVSSTKSRRGRSTTPKYNVNKRRSLSVRKSITPKRK